MKTERWLPVQGFEDYQVSDLGRVCSLKHGKQRILRSSTAQRYFGVSLQDGKHRKRCLVHRLVCLAFLGNPPAGKPEVNHIDGDTHNNALANLEWTSKQANHLHAREKTKRNSTPRGMSATTKQAIELVRTGGMTAYAAAKATGIALSTIYRALGKLLKR